jgi:putative ABC transport system substrate-binding protein
MSVEAVPKTALIGFLVNPTNADADSTTKNALAAAEMLGQKLLVEQARTDSELETAFVTLVQKHAGALVVGADIFLPTDATRSLNWQHVKKCRRSILLASLRRPAV